MHYRILYVPTVPEESECRSMTQGLSVLWEVGILFCSKLNCRKISNIVLFSGLSVFFNVAMAAMVP